MNRDVRASLFTMSKLLWSRNIEGLFTMSNVFRHLTISFSFDIPKGISLSKEIREEFSILKQKTLHLKLIGDNRHNG